MSRRIASLQVEGWIVEEKNIDRQRENKDRDGDGDRDRDREKEG